MFCGKFSQLILELEKTEKPKYSNSLKKQLD